MSTVPISSPRTQASALVEQLRRDIVAGVLPPGGKLKISDLAATYGAGVIPTREALARLSSSGLVVAEDQRGFRVAPVSLDELQDLGALRRTLETRALVESMSQGDIEWETRLIAAHHRMSRLDMRTQHGEAGFAEDWDAAHVEFHLALLGACRSPWLMQFVRMLGEQMNRYRHLSTRADQADTRDIATEHTTLLEAALARDADRACMLLCDHFSRTEADAREALSRL
ncbi:GntR family transcriptional regulator [Caballeronia sp. LZ035]|uniref:GntR family transcriptional regulator n=1 Tax=Caballeronia sp. LZ035 TaxID=3038568 RepID=UPI00286D2EE1|nr:GntR family transcriptional regulator [Caballeronia sp. LZ035]